MRANTKPTGWENAYSVGAGSDSRRDNGLGEERS